MRPRIDALQASDLELVLALLEHGSLSGAAKAIGVRQSTLSRQLTKLEETLGRPLFSRDRAGLVPTAGALALRPFAEQVALATRQAQKIAWSAEDVAGRIRLALPEAIADWMVAPRLPELLETHPGLEVEILASSRVADLARLEADVAVRFGAMGDGDLVTRRIASLALALFAATPEAAERGWLAMHPPTEAEHLMQRLLRTEPRLRANRAPTLIAAARAGMGALLLPRVFGAQVAGLVEVDIAVPAGATLDLYLASPRAIRSLPAVDTMWQWFTDLLSP